MLTLSISPNALRRAASLASVAVAGTLIVAKVFAFFETHSVALLSSLVDSGVDMLASVITAYGVAQAMRPADREHRFGHGKAESLAAMAQAAFITGASILLLVEAFNRLRNPQPLQDLTAGYFVMTLAIVLTALLLALQTYTVRKTSSLAIASDRLHYVGDILINLTVMASFALHDLLDLSWIDPVFAVMIGASLLWGAWKIGREAMDVLMDAELPEADRNTIAALALSVPGVVGLHDMRTRSDSEKQIVEMHIEMPPTLPLAKAHDIAEAVMHKVRTAYPRADILVHQDPQGVVEERLDVEIEKDLFSQD